MQDPKRHTVTLSLTKQERNMLLDAARSFKQCDEDTLRLNNQTTGEQGYINTQYGEVNEDLIFSWNRIVHQLEGKALLNSEFDNRKQLKVCPICKEKKILLGSHMRWCEKRKDRPPKIKKIKLRKPDPETLERLRLL